MEPGPRGPRLHLSREARGTPVAVGGPRRLPSPARAWTDVRVCRWAGRQDLVAGVVRAFRRGTGASAE